MTRHDLVFDINYSYFLEKMSATLTGRIDRFISVTLMVLGCAVFSPYSGVFIFGVLIAALSAVQFIYQFGKISGLSEEQAKRYLQLMTEEANLSDSDLLVRFCKLQENDSSPFGLLKGAAFKRTCYKLGFEDTSDSLANMEKIVSWLAGDLPKVPRTNS